MTENYEIERVWEEIFDRKLQEPSRNLSGGTREITKNLRIIVVPADIQTEQLPNTSRKN
jgi:hypothetical protein